MVDIRPITAKATDPITLQRFIDRMNQTMRRLTTMLDSLPVAETVTEDTTAGASTGLLVDASAGAVTITLPEAVADRMYWIKKIDSSDNEVTVTVDDTASEEIDGATTAVITDQYECITVLCDGTDWWIV